jgi:cytoskeleton-associated protein 5
LLEVLDIVLKWGNIKLTESSNTQLFISLMDFFGNIMQYMIDMEIQAEDFEMAVLLGTLCERAGVNNKNLIIKVRKLIKMCYEVYGFKLCYRMIIESGVKSKNLKSVAENLDEIADFICLHGVDCCTKKDFALFLTCVDNSDKNVRENALKALGEAYKLLGEDVWRLFGKDIVPKVKSMIEARFK